MTTVWGIIMSKQIEDYIDENLIDEAKTVALDLVGKIKYTIGLNMMKTALLS